MTLNKRWLVSSQITPQADENLTSFPPILRQLLFNRGYATDAEARAFLKAEPDFNTDPFQIKDMPATIDRIRFAIDHHEPIAIYGDYDVDGVTATALLVQSLKALGADVRGYIPNRFDEGYGLNNDALDNLKADGVKLVITVDCGIRSPEEALHAQTVGLDLVISDHHHPSAELPTVFSVINPKQEGDVYPDKNLAGVGIAYKIAQALLDHKPQANNDSLSTIANSLLLTDLLDLVALGTVADLAPLVGENRSLVRKGLKQIRETKRQGLFSLANVAEIVIGKTTAGQIGFVLGPRLNAAGRLESALASFELLTTTDFMRAGQLAQQLDVQNRQRQAITRAMQEKAEALVLAQEEHPFLLFAADEEFNPGVVGLAASRLTETYYRPAVVAAKGPEETRGSCRSIPEFHITDALDQCADLLVRHGGHAAAAGFTVRNEKLPELVARLKSIAEAQLSGKDLRQTLAADMEVKLSELNFDLLKHLNYFEPTGYGNPDAVFVSRNVKVKGSRTVGAEGKHLKLTLEDERGLAFDAIGFRLGHLQSTLPGRVDVIYSFESNEFNGRTSLQLNLKDVRAAGSSD
ncbi:MAG TPA: single-stranded-DNA-specific exonuclease RecJ [Anaerolineales bacterium]|nr:single-stranded-DNA-specific exonuclease RecJ [Anaerolineales bacterium]